MVAASFTQAQPPRPLTMRVMVPVLLALTVVEAMDGVNAAIAKDVIATVLSASDGTVDGFLSWPHKLAVRVQMALVRVGSDLAEPIGRCLDAALASSANGQSFKPWASPPLPGLTPRDPALNSSDAPMKISAVPTTPSSDRPSPPASRPLTPPKQPSKAHASSAKNSTPTSKMNAPARMASMACLVMTCAVQLDFSMLGVTVPAVQVSDVPTNETAESISYATAGLLHLQPHEVGLLRADNTVVSPRVPLWNSSLVLDGEVHLCTACPAVVDYHVAFPDPQHLLRLACWRPAGAGNQLYTINTLSLRFKIARSC